MRILVVEDEPTMAESLRSGLTDEGFAVDLVANGEDALCLAGEVAYDAIVLDLMLPKVNGFIVCRTLRGRGDWTPILMLTAKDGHLDEAEGLDTGADDYLTKPFSCVVLLARLRVLLRRALLPRPSNLSQTTGQGFPLRAGKRSLTDSPDSMRPATARRVAAVSASPS